MSSAASSCKPIIWQDVACPLCEACAEVPVLEIPGENGEPPFRLVNCARCGLGYLNPRPDEASIARFYPDDYLCYRREPGKRWQSGWFAYLKRLAAYHSCGLPSAPRGWGTRLLARLAATCLAPDPDSLTSLPYQGQGQLLEYGCGAGWLCRRMRDLGWNVTGMDFSAFAAEKAQRLYGLPVVVGSLPHPAILPESYDVIVMGQVLEHVHRPHAVIEAAARALRPGGYLAVAVPNMASWSCRTFREDWWGLQLPIHLLHFTPTTLQRLLEAHGLEVRRLSQPRHSGWMRHSLAAARSRNAGRLPLWLRALSRSRIGINLLTRWSVAAGMGDTLLMIAHRPGASCSRSAA